jgi:hypothetical protein
VQLSTVALVAGSRRRWELKSCVERKDGELTLVPLRIKSDRNALRNLSTHTTMVAAPKNTKV